MFPGMFWVKYLFRVMHIGSLVIVCQSVITAKMTGQVPTDHKVLYMLAGIFVIVSGLVNTYILSPKDMGERRKPWVAYSHIKTLTAVILFSPLVKRLPIQAPARIDIQFYWMVLALVLSPFARYYREHFVAKEKERREKALKEDDNSV